MCSESGSWGRDLQESLGVYGVWPGGWRSPVVCIQLPRPTTQENPSGKGTFLEFSSHHRSRVRLGPDSQGRDPEYISTVWTADRRAEEGSLRAPLASQVCALLAAPGQATPAGVGAPAGRARGIIRLPRSKPEPVSQPGAPQHPGCRLPAQPPERFGRAEQSRCAARSVASPLRLADLDPDSGPGTPPSPGSPARLGGGAGPNCAPPTQERARHRCPGRERGGRGGGDAVRALLAQRGGRSRRCPGLASPARRA